jgi:TolA-binding protein
MTLRSSTLVLVALMSGCATRQTPPPATPAQVVRFDMDPIKIEATPSAAGGVQVEAFDAQELFEQAGAALSQNRHDDAIRLYDKLLASFGESAWARAAMYNRGLAFRDKKDWQGAVAAFKAMVEKYPDHADSKDGLFQLGACYAEMNNWPASGEVFVRLLERKDLNADDRVEAMARRGFAQFNLKDLDAADKTFRGVLAYKKQIENDERLATDFYLAFSQYHLGQIAHERFRGVPLRLPEAQMDRDLDLKASLLLQAQRGYIDTIKYGNPGWASAAGFQVGSLYEELYDAFTNAPVPPELKGEARDVYQDELRKKIRILLEKSLRWQRENLLMIERLGVNTDWAEKSKLAYNKLLRLLDPNAKPLEPGAAPSPAQPPGTPTAPQRTPQDNDKTKAQPPAEDPAFKRQIL